MKFLQKLVPFITPTACLMLIFPAFANPTEELEALSSYTRYKQSPQKMSPKLSFEIFLHGLSLWASMGLLMPAGILVIRMSSRTESGRRKKILSYSHAIMQTLSVLLSTAGAIMSVKNFENSFSNNHQRLGVALYGVVWLQALVGFLRPQRGTKRRSIWFFVHWLLGTAVSVLGVINIYTGLEAYQKRTEKSIRLWTALFTAEITLLACFYLFQEKWDYIQKQGVTLVNDPIDTIKYLQEAIRKERNLSHTEEST